MNVSRSHDVRRKVHAALRPIVAAVLLVVLPAEAADWQVTPTFSVRETYTDNVALAPPGAEESDFVTQLIPGVRIEGVGPHLNARAYYNMENVYYARDSERNDIFHDLSADGTAELWDQFFFVDGMASISQEPISAFGARSTDNTSDNQNRTEVNTYRISPYIRHHFKNFASMESRYTYDSVSTNTGGYSDSTADTVEVSLTSGPDFRKLGWGANYRKERIDYDSGQTTDLLRYSGSLRLLLTPQFRLTGEVGYEDNQYDQAIGSSSGSLWNAGFEWNPSQRTSVAATAGRRYFGDTYSASVNHRSRRTAWTLSYDESVTDTRSEFVTPSNIDTASYLDGFFTSIITDPAERRQFIDSLIRDGVVPASLADSVNFLSNRFYLQKSLRAAVTATGVRNTVTISLYNSKREALTDQLIDSELQGLSNLSLQDDTTQTGVEMFWNWKLSSRTSANIRANLSRTTSSDETDRKDDDKMFSINLRRELQPQVHGTVELRHNERDSDEPSDEYEENAISASLNIEF